MLVASLAPQKRSLDIDATICVPEQLLKHIQGSDGRRIYRRAADYSAGVVTKYDSLALGIMLTQGASTNETKVKLRDLFGPNPASGHVELGPGKNASADPAINARKVFEAARQGALFGGKPQTVFAERPVPFSVTITLLGQPDAYPFDWYEASSEISVELPNELLLARPVADGGFRVSRTLPTDVSVRSGPGVGDFATRTRIDPADDGAQLKIYLGTESATRGFVVFLLAVPLLFASVLASIARLSGGDVRNLLIALVTAALTLLPIRQVLVPAAFQGLTLVDWLLGAEIFVLFGMALWFLPRARYRAQ